MQLQNLLQVEKTESFTKIIEGKSKEKIIGCIYKHP